VALALVEEGEVRVAVLGCPHLPVDPGAPEGPRGVLFHAVRGEGAFARPMGGGQPRRIRVAADADPAASRMVESVETRHGHLSLQERIAASVGLQAQPVRMDSQAKYGAVARGEAALYLRLPSPRTPDYRENIWDHAAGALLVEEAGGRVTDLHGAPLAFASGRRMEGNRGVVATNGALHERVLEELARIF
jgi:3'(2'), 5'-bisphosphate nucleotidase